MTGEDAVKSFSQGGIVDCYNEKNIVKEFAQSYWLYSQVRLFSLDVDNL